MFTNFTSKVVVIDSNLWPILINKWNRFRAFSAVFVLAVSFELRFINFDNAVYYYN